MTWISTLDQSQANVKLLLAMIGFKRTDAKMKLDLIENSYPICFYAAEDGEGAPSCGYEIVIGK